MTDPEYEVPNDSDVTSTDIVPGAILRDADLSDADLREADLSDADLREADLSDADLRHTDLSGADLINADLSETHLRDADLSESYLGYTDLSRAHLRHADLSRADLWAADLSQADLTHAELDDTLLLNVSLSDALVSRKTVLDPPRKQLEAAAESEELDLFFNRADLWDAVARANNELKTVYSNNGLISQARKTRTRERRARRQEAKVDETLHGTVAWAGSLISRWTTGYGVKLLPVIGIMLALFLGSAAVYWEAGLDLSESLYYSVVTFTTSPPADPESEMMRLVAGIETFLGTTMIVFLGYVLGAREQV